MVTGVIQKVFQKNESKNWPGAVQFTDGTKLSTFQEKLIAIAEGGIGREAEYETEIRESKNGKVYKNLKSIWLSGSGNSGTAPLAPITTAPAPANIAGIVELVAAIRENTIEMRDLLTEFRKPIVPVSGIRTLELRPEDPYVPPASVTTASDPLADAQERLGCSIGHDAAAAQFDYLRTKFAKRPAELAEKVKSLLAANGVE